MNHASKSRIRARSTHFAVALSAVVFALVASTLVVSNVAIAATGLKVVRGYVWDSAGTPVEGAEVVVNMLAQSDSSIRATHSWTAISTGYYSVTFAMDEWDEGDTIQVIATYNSIQQPPNSTAAVSGVIQWVNVTGITEIPEFGSYLGLLIAGGAIGIVGIAVVSMKRRR